uniref:Uncharacterized protein n=1 Tax=Phaseolus vulgaris TaxID=3885 RepID=V7B9C5_PHAVU|nr:hypothetical protein PHAVU_008G257100g [Phaseolus vulgaris]ESW14150.1 hypothetical protein PHAVU_008G257100g [Phaseolus vulgaris]
MEALCLRWVNGWSWLKKPKVQRLVCLASSVVGLICYALSSTFNRLLGNWSWWKMLLYIVFSFIIFLAVWFAPPRSSSTSHRLKAHLAFFVLIITSVYSFWFDNVVKGKPDAYSLISCAAFATMSLGLSNLTQLGFQIDLLYFFCGSLTVQLMKIKLWLVIVGGGFSYSLLQLRYCPRDTEGENLQLQVPHQKMHKSIYSLKAIRFHKMMAKYLPKLKGKIRPQIDIFDAPQVHILYENVSLTPTTERIATLYNSDGRH